MRRAGEQIDPAESARVVEHNPARPVGTVHLQHHVVMPADLRLSVMQAHRPRHAEMHQHRLVAVKRQQQEFAAPPQAAETPPGEARGKVLRQRPAKVGPADMGGGHLPVLQRRHKRPANRFNLGKFRHG